MDWTEKDQKEYDAIVDQLRRQGWDRYDAMEEADIKMSERKEHRAKKEASEE
ncbi:hypothetical protein [Sulfitobacter sp. R18_1]|uniref:hypothetical protein n=1 Tax=Sulfitobacter sp. R18_1 TaxID=2821104 RepID=UPI001ADAD5E2|nr:hypothetical protein [Sulfitobacter sp. R18_1]MBO9428714.1 hypothetical protein [Sulfitobacter sp. R18_1]